MLKIDSTEDEIEQLHHKRYHHPHPKVQKKIEVLYLIAYLLVQWIYQRTLLPQLDWKVASDLALSILFPSVLWFQFLRHLRSTAHIAAHYQFEIVFKSLPILTYQE